MKFSDAPVNPETALRKARREELAKDLLLKLVETNGGRGQYDINYNVRAAVDYTDALLAELEKVK
jgi:hypothetical protein